MRRYARSAFCKLLASLALIASLAGCGGKGASLGLMSDKDKIDPNLPAIGQVRYIADVSSIAFEWDKIENPNAIKGFVIYQANSSGNNKKIATIKSPYATHFVVDSLLPQTTYTFQIATLGSDNAISQSPAKITIKTSFIDPIEKAFASSDYAKAIKLIWSPHPNPSITRYIIQRKNDAGKFLNIATVKNRLLVEYFDDDLDDAREYTYRIIAQDFNGIKSLPSEEIQGSTREKPKPITNLKASQDLAKDIQLSWPAVPGATKYEIYISESVQGAYKPLVQVNKNYYMHKVGKDNAVYFYKVRAIDESGVAGDLPNGATQGATLPPPPTPQITKGVIQNNQAIIEWGVINNARVKGYAVYRYEGRSSNPLRFTNTIKTRFVDKEMQQGKRYIYKVVSVDANGNESLPSQEVELLIK
ncbi:MULTISPECIES: fibronectin type III domain-containing protein [unclassified Helicobacter]|uniref:fibronectin type III domain-containing protein n=1 Tax=unclassified Helicobacter TaxID=2593540 RepID=UPI0009EDFB43|nr:MULTISPECIES: fibronectin type III domain-containing protein [unclassified Helicobacter]